MKPIEEFPYSDKRWQYNPMHERMLLLQTNGGIGLHFAIGYYDVVHDIFCVICEQGHLNIEKNPYSERPVSGSYADHERWKRYGYDNEGIYDNNRSGYWDQYCKECMHPGYYCIMPDKFVVHIGTRCIKGFMTMDDALTEMIERDLFIDDPAKVLDADVKCKYCKYYLLVLTDNRILIGETSCFCKSGDQFAAFSPTDIRGTIYHMSGPVPREQIQYVVNLEELGGIQK